MKELNPERAFCSIVTPYPKTELHKICSSEGIIPQNIDWNTFFHQSPSMYLTKHLTRGETTELIRYTEEIFDKHNKHQLIKLILKHPLRPFKLIFEWGYAKPRFVKALVRTLFHWKRAASLMFHKDALAKQVMASPLTPLIYAAVELLRPPDEKETASEIGKRGDHLRKWGYYK